MSLAHLGPQIDIHGGGSDLIFPHHENESAQSRCALGTPRMANFWLHNGMLTLGQEKMSKSVGNIERIIDLRRRHPPELLRYALLSGQYRSPLAWSPDLIAQAQASLNRLYQALRDVPGDDTSIDYQHSSQWPDEVVTALADDLNTPGALAAMHAIASAMNRANDPAQAQQLRASLLAGGWLLGLLDKSPEDWFKGVDTESLDSAAIDGLIEARNEARRQKNFQRADEIRQELLRLGIELEDSRDGTRWRRVTHPG